MLEGLPLLELFTKLRKAGLSIGIDEYCLILRALQAGFGTANRNSLKRLCERIWVKSSDEMQIFNYYFERIIPLKDNIDSSKLVLESSADRDQSSRIKDSDSSIVNSSSPTSAPSFPPETTDKAQLETNTAFNPIDKNEYKPSTLPFSLLSKSLATSSNQPLGQVIDTRDEVQAQKALLEITDRDTDVLDFDRFVLNNEYLPITRRQMKQSWRYLRHLVHEGLLTELDIEATVDQIGRQGFFTKLITKHRLINRTELLLLLDQDGSMVPFHRLSERFIETSVWGGNLGKILTYYFHNYPIGYLYENSTNKAEPIREVLKRLNSSRSSSLY